MVTDQPTKKAKSAPAVSLQENGLPEGVTILPLSPDAPTPKLENMTTSKPRPTAQSTTLITTRSRLDTKAEALANADTAKLRTKRRKPGRPKAGRLDTPKPTMTTDIQPATSTSVTSIATTTATVAPEPQVPVPSVLPASSIPTTVSSRSMSDIAPRRPRHQPSPVPPKPALHKVGLPPLHYGSVLKFSLRARIRIRLVALASLAAISVAAAISYGTWLLLTGGLAAISEKVMHAGPVLVIEAAILAALYYIGRSIGQAGIIYGVARETDHRPVSLSRQLGVGINAFGRRLQLDLTFGIGEIALIALGALLVFTGGTPWPVDHQLQIAAIFCAFMVLLYLFTALALTRGLAGVALTLSTHSPMKAARMGWGLFSHRFELLGLRFLALAMELVLTIPLAVLAIGFITSAPPQLHIVVAGGVGILAWLAGAMLGAGTASWWAALYRQLVLADRSEHSETLLTHNQPQDARRGALTFIVALTSLLIALALTLPWLKFF